MKKVLLSFLILIGMVLVYVSYQYYKPHKNINTAKEDISVTAPILYNDYTNSESRANQKYLNKLVLVSGLIDEISVDNSGYVNVYLNVASDVFGSVSCNFNRDDGKKALNYVAGGNVIIKGICTGYTGTDFLGDVVLSKCVIVE